MKLKTKSCFHPNPKILILLTIFIYLISCKKNDDHQILPIKVLSENSTDYGARLNAIKEKFYADKLDQKLIPNVKQTVVWEPDWDHPKSQIVNDSVSYIFYRLVAYLKKEGKLLEAKEVGTATYLMVKNEKEFFKAFYFHPANTTNKLENSKTLSVENFTGNLLLKNLKSGKSFLLDYVNGTVSQTYNNRRLLAINRSGMKPSDVNSYIETQCHTELRSCLFASDSPGYCSGIEIVYSPNCLWPPNMCGVTYSLIDSSLETVCQDVWFPDPPTDPGNSGGETNNGGELGRRELNTDSVKNKYPCADKLILQPIFNSRSMSEFVAPFLTDQKPTLTYRTANLPWGNGTSGGTYKLGHAHYDPTSRTGLSSIVTLNEKMLENSSPLFNAVTIVHETLHGFINYNISMAEINVRDQYTDNSNWLAALNGFYQIRGLPSNYSQHSLMLSDYFDKAVEVVSAWDQQQNIKHTNKEIAMAMMFGLNTADPGTPQNFKDNLNSAFELIKIKYEITDAELATFNRNQLNSINRLPTTGCN